MMLSSELGKPCPDWPSTAGDYFITFLDNSTVHEKRCEMNFMKLMTSSHQK
jgi:hypothetical protein